MRKFIFISVATVVQELRDIGINIHRVHLYRLEKKIPEFPKVQTKKGDWRKYTRSEADQIIAVVKKHYRVE